MAEAVDAREDGHEGAELGNLCNRTEVDLADHSLSRERPDDLDGLSRRLLGGGGDLDGAVVLHLDGDARLLLDGTDGLAARTDDVADAVDRNLDGRDARRVGRQLFVGRGEDGVHLAEDVETTLAGLQHGLAHHATADAVDLDVHLEAGDATLGAGHLEVHVAEVVLIAEDVGEDDVIVTLFDETHRDACDGRLDGHAGMHEGERAAADGGHRGGAVRLENLGDDADGVGELLVRGDDLLDRAAGEEAVAHFATAGRTHALDLTHREGGEVVVEHEVLVALAMQVFVELGVAIGSERDGDQGLGLAAGEERRAVGAGKDADLDRDGTNVAGAAAVDALALLDDNVAQRVALELLEAGSDLALAARVGLGELGAELSADLVDGGVAAELIRDGHGLGELGADELGDGLEEGCVKLGRDEGHLLLAGLFGELDLELDEGLNGLEAEVQRVEHVVFARLVGLALDHDDGVLGAGDDDVDVAEGALRPGGVGDELALDAADADCGDGAREGCVAQHQRGGGAGDGEDVGVVLTVVGDDLRDDLDFALETLGEEGAEGAVREAAGEDFSLGELTLTTLESAGDATAGVELLDVLHAEREEAGGLLVGTNAGGDENGGLTGTDDDRAAGLFGHASRLDRDGVSAERGRLTNHCTHEGSLG